MMNAGHARARLFVLSGRIAMIILGLTGGIACGKTTVADTLRNLGAAVVDGDAISHAMTAPGGPALPAIRESFGDDMFDSEGRLIRSRLAGVVFSDPAALETLNSVMQPMIREEILRQIRWNSEKSFPVCVLDMPLLFEEHLDRLCDLVWCVYLDRETQIRRLTERDGCTRDQALSRIASQMSTEEKAARSQLVISTQGTMEETRRLTEDAYHQLCAQGGMDHVGTH